MLEIVAENGKITFDFGGRVRTCPYNFFVVSELEKLGVQFSFGFEPEEWEASTAKVEQVGYLLDHYDRKVESHQQFLAAVEAATGKPLKEIPWGARTEPGPLVAEDLLNGNRVWYAGGVMQADHLRQIVL